jgi:uncharacterized protein (DUF1330 family)
MFSSVPSGAPVLMLNLVRFREQALNLPGEEPRSGREAYAKYLELFQPLLDAVGGSMYWMGKVHQTLISPTGELWDEVLVVRYPRVEAFAGLLRTPEYKTILPHRQAGLCDTRLLVTSEVLSERE